VAALRKERGLFIGGAAQAADVCDEPRRYRGAGAKHLLGRRSPRGLLAAHYNKIPCDPRSPKGDALGGMGGMDY